MACPACDADVSVPVPASAQIIDVHAEGLNDPEPEPEPAFDDGPFFNPERQRPVSGQMGGRRTIFIQRGGDGSGCCLVGCLGISFLLYLVIRGFFSLFQ